MVAASRVSLHDLQRHAACSYADMDPTQFKRAWPERRGAITAKWNRMTQEEVDAIDGRLELLVGKIRDRYEVTEAEANRQVAEFLRGDASPAQRDDEAGGLSAS